MKIRPIFFIFFILLFSMSCKKEPPHYTISDEMKQYFAYKKNSWWVYVNDSTKSIDSTYLTNVIYSTQGVDDDGKELYSYDFIGLSFKSQFLTEFVMQNNCDQKNTKLYIELGDGLGTSFNPVAYVEGVPPYKDYFTNCGRPFGALWIETYQFLTINEIPYFNIIHTILKYSEQSGTQIKNKVLKFYFAKNVGLLKYQYLLNDTLMISWSLKNYNTIQ